MRESLEARLLREAFERAANDPPPHRTSVHYSELTEDRSSGPTAEGWNVYVREVGRLIAEGHEVKWFVIAEGRLLGVYDTKGEGYDAIIDGKFKWPATLEQIQVREQLVPAPIRAPRRAFSSIRARARLETARPHIS